MTKQELEKINDELQAAVNSLVKTVRMLMDVAYLAKRVCDCHPEDGCQQLADLRACMAELDRAANDRLTELGVPVDGETPLHN